MGTFWYVSNLLIHSDLVVPYLAEHIRSIAQSLYSTFPDAKIPLFQQLRTVVLKLWVLTQ